MDLDGLLARLIELGGSDMHLEDRFAGDGPC